MALVNITPVMTSNTTPAPYVVSASSSLETTDAYVWNAFDGTTTGITKWETVSGIIAAWIKIDFGSVKTIDAFSIKCKTGFTSAPKDFVLYGSNDNIIYESITTLSNEILWSADEDRLYRLQCSVSYRYYKLNIITNNGFTSTAIRKLKFYQESSTQVINNKSSMAYCLPSNTKNALDMRSNDLREGMLCYVNDIDDYGELRLINKSGKAQMPMTAMQNADLLFDGSASVTATTYTLSKDYSKYKYLLVRAHIVNANTTGCGNKSLLIPTSEISTTISGQNSIGTFATAAAYFHMSFHFASINTFIIDCIDKAAGATAPWSSPCIYKIYGLK